MNDETIETLFDLFEQNSTDFEKCRINLKELYQRNSTINMESLIRDLTTDVWSQFFCLSNDRKEIHLNNPINICLNNSNQCQSCDSLHICLNYLLNKSCQEFDQTGQCSSSHSLFTKQNEKVLKKYFLFNAIRNYFSFLHRLFQLTNSRKDKETFQNQLILQDIHQEKIDETLIDQYLEEYKSFLLSKTILDPYTIQLRFLDDEITSMMENILCQTKFKKIDSQNENQSKSSFIDRQKTMKHEILSIDSSSNPFETSRIKNPFGNRLYSNMGRGRARDSNSLINSSLFSSTTNSNENQDEQNQFVSKKSFSTRLNKTNSTRIDSSINSIRLTSQSQQEENFSLINQIENENSF